DFRADLADDEIEASDGLSLYVHVPFCDSLCHFCACNKLITPDHTRAAGYLDTIEREIEAVRAATRVPRAATQLHWGGGTPTWLAPDEIQRLFRSLSEAFPLRAAAEISIEVDPRVTTREHVDVLAECGFNRISMGVQDFDPRVQQGIRRVQGGAGRGGLAECARRAAFESVTFALIYGLPSQPPATFDRTLDQLFAIGPDRIALY